MAAASTVMATAAVIGAIAAAGSAGYSVYSGEKARKEQKKESKAQQAAINEENKRALSERKQKIDQLRMQMSGTGEGTRGISTSGVKANIGGGGISGNSLG